MLELKNLSVSSAESTILENINLSFDEGVHIIMGPNGAGKSSLAHAIMGNPKYDVSGNIIFRNQDITDFPTHLKAQEGIFLSFQNPTPIEGLSNFQLIRQMLQHKLGFKIQDALHGFRGLANDFNLPSDWDKQQLNVYASGGEKKKNEIIQMIMANPDVAILDEPDSGLDIDAINLLIDRLTSFTKNENKCVIIISHYEKLLKSLNPDSITIIAKKSATQYKDVSIIDEILTNGFASFNSP